MLRPLAALTSLLALAAVTAPPAIAVAAPTKVLVVVEENHTQSSAMQGMPYLASLARSDGYTTAYRAVAHPSLPNYLALAGGSTYGVTDDGGPAQHRVPGPSVFDQALSGHRTAKAYVEAMPSPCATSSTGRYAVKHNPWPYFSDAAPRAACRRFDVPAGTFSSGALRHDVDAGTLPTVGLLVPDLCHDGHDCSLGTADGWLKQWLPVIFNGPDYRAGRLAVVVTFDEDDSSGNNTVLTAVLSPYTRRVVSAHPFTHYSLTRYAAELCGTRPLRNASSARSVRADFHV